MADSITRQCLEHLSRVQQYLESIAKREDEDTRPTINYYVAYWQLYKEDGKEEWVPNHQWIIARDIQEVFTIMGRIIQEYSLVIRDMRYGLYSKMGEEQKIIDSYWKRQEDQ